MEICIYQPYDSADQGKDRLLLEEIDLVLQDFSPNQQRVFQQVCKKRIGIHLRANLCKHQSAGQNKASKSSLPVMSG